MEFKYSYGSKRGNKLMKDIIKTDLGEFRKALVVDGFIYYINYQESDENASTIMYRENGDLVSDNYFASMDCLEQLEKVYRKEVKADFVSKEALENIKLYLESLE